MVLSARFILEMISSMMRSKLKSNFELSSGLCRHQLLTSILLYYRCSVTSPISLLYSLEISYLAMMEDHPISLLLG